MKKVAIKFLLLIGAFPTFAQIENGGFENWETLSNGAEKPIGWSSNNILSTTIDLPLSQLSFIKDPTPYSGSYAVTLKNTLEEKQNEDIVTYYATYGNLFLGNFEVKEYKLPGQAINEVPTTITGYYKFSQGAPLKSDIYDTATVEVVLAKWNPTTEIFDRLVTRKLQIFEANTEYAKFTIDLDYSGDAMPDKLSIFLSTAPHSHSGFNGTSLTIDELSYNTVTSLSLPISNLYSSKAYPNPATTEINFKDLPEESRSIIVKDLSGRVVKTLLLISDNINIGTSDLNSGMYLYTVMGSEQNVLYTGKFDIKK
ncbi:MAG: PCMD domain-containing protein [Sporocytophaga sp.]|uniref:T9SS type A sorting domain-containing protein n=1 Tax=Sporocytophaga sp. TaxID=2231183 RepID=UPI001B23A5E7|nr:T9SS type A sorting domain-containing protein [Sporocytophaga sp.]MBO9698677.1 PCMD domain-containing protein [Sporocytophaga sp.]